MNQANPPKARILPMRRLALLATTVAGLAVGGFLVAPTLVALRAAGAWRRICRRRRSSSRGRPALPTSSRR